MKLCKRLQLIFETNTQSLSEQLQELVLIRL